MKAVLPRLKELMRAGIETVEPNHSYLRRLDVESVFNGSFDLHSCILAHWALLVMARTEGDLELEAWLLERLNPEVLARERAHLAALDEEPWTFPYEHAWLAMLLSELSRRAEGEPPRPFDAELVRGFRLQIEERLLEALETRSFPENVPPPERGGTGFNGFYKSWQFAFLLLQWCEPVVPDAAERLEALRRDKLEPQREALAALTRGSEFDFLHVPALLPLIDRTAPPGAGVPDRSPYTAEPLQPLPEEVSLGTVHVVGVHLSRVWPSAVDAGAGDAAARGTFNTQMKRVLARGDLWSDDFTVVSHWVPQYLWIGIWLASGRP